MKQAQEQREKLVRGALWLVLGAILQVGVHMRWGIALLAWVAWVPWLRYLRQTEGWRSRLLFAMTAFFAWVIIVFKITTAPLHPSAALLFGIPIGFFFVSGFLIWDRLQSAITPLQRILLFPALMVCMEWLQRSFTPFASWGAAAYTQVGQLAWLQVTSLVGMGGLGFLLYGTSSLLEESISTGQWQKRRLLGWVGLLLTVYSFGSWRLSQSAERKEEVMRVAAVSTDATFGPQSLPSTKALQKINEVLFARTRKAASMGAKVIVWNEGATLTWPKQEDAWLRRLGKLTRSIKTHLVAAYIVPLPTKPSMYENKYVWFSPKGLRLHTYRKRHPVFGEPAVAGKKPLSAVLVEGTSMSGAICYDFDYPREGRGHAALGVGLVVLPSSDWKGIHPYHTEMAAIRAIESGFSLLRSTRLGLSAGIDAYGRMRAWQSWFDQTERVMIADLPTRSIKTMYGRWGDLFVLFCAVHLCACGLRVRSHQKPTE